MPPAAQTGPQVGHAARGPLACQRQSTGAAPQAWLPPACRRRRRPMPAAPRAAAAGPAAAAPRQRCRGCGCTCGAGQAAAAGTCTCGPLARGSWRRTLHPSPSAGLKVLQPVRTKRPGAENGGNTRALAPQKHTQKVLTPRARPQQTPLRPRPQWVQLLVANPGPAQPSAKEYRQAQAPGERGRSVHGRRRAGRLRWSLPGCQSRSKESETTLGWAPGRARSSLLQGRLSQPGLLPASPPRRCRPSRPIQGSTMLSASSWEPHKGRQGA